MPNENEWHGRRGPAAVDKSWVREQKTKEGWSRGLPFEGKRGAKKRAGQDGTTVGDHKWPGRGPAVSGEDGGSGWRGGRVKVGNQPARILARKKGNKPVGHSANGETHGLGVRG